MRVNIPLTVTITTGVACFFSLLVLSLAASFNIKRRNYNIMWNQIIEVSNPAANGMIAGSVFNMLWFGFFTFFLFWRPDSIFISMIVDTSFLGFLWLFSIATTGSMTAQAPYFGNCNHADKGGHCGVGRAAIAFGWLTWFLITFLLVLKVTYTLMHYGRSLDTWKTPFNELVLYGNKGTGLAGSGSAGSGRTEEGGQRQMSNAQVGYGHQSYTSTDPYAQHTQHSRYDQSRAMFPNSELGSVDEQVKMQTPGPKAEMGEYIPVRQLA